MRRPIGADSTDEIDLLDADPAAFSHHTAHGHAPRAPRAPRSRSPRRRWAVAAAVFVSVATLAGLLVWQPWVHPDQWRELPVQPLSSPTLTRELVLDRPPGDVMHVSTPSSESTTAGQSLGYVFADVASTYDDGRWASFSAVPNGTEPSPPTNDATSVRGVEADVRTVRQRATVTWGPHAGYDWTVNTNGLTEPEALAFAQAVFARAGEPVLAGSYRLDALQPLGGIETLQRVRSLAAALASNEPGHPVRPSVVTYATDGTPVLLGSMPVAADGLIMAEFVFGAGTTTTVHGQPARVIHGRGLGTVVAWMEGGRLVTVAGGLPAAEMVALAESVRPATPGEWAAATSAGTGTP